MNLISKCILKRKKYAQGYFDTEELSDVDNVYIVTKNGQYGLLDGATRKLIMLMQDTKITSYSDGLVGVSKNGKAGYMDLKNKQVVDFIYDNAAAFQSNHLARVSKDDMTGYINRNTLETVIPVKYDYISNFTNGYAAILHRGKCGYVDEHGVIVGGLVFDQIGDIGEGLIAVKKGTKWGYINLAGKEVIPFKYSSAEAFEDGYAVVKQNGKLGVINMQGEKVIACRYDDIKYVSDDIACVLLDGKVGYVDTHDKTIVPCELMTSLGITDEDYTMALNHIKFVFSERAKTIKSQAAKDRLLREFNREMQKMADARVAYYAYLTEQEQKQYRTTQLRIDCVEEISTSKQGQTEPDGYEILDVMAENDQTLANDDTAENATEAAVSTTTTSTEDALEDIVAEPVDDIVIPEFNPEEELADGTEYDDIAATVPDDEIEHNV